MLTSMRLGYASDSQGQDRLSTNLSPSPIPWPSSSAGPSSVNPEEKTIPLTPVHSVSIEPSSVVQATPTTVVTSQNDPSTGYPIAELLNHFPDLSSFILHPWFPEFSRTWVGLQRHSVLVKDPQHLTVTRNWLRFAASRVESTLSQLERSVDEGNYATFPIVSAFRRLHQQISIVFQRLLLLDPGHPLAKPGSVDTSSYLAHPTLSSPSTPSPTPWLDTPLCYPGSDSSTSSSPISPSPLSSSMCGCNHVGDCVVENMPWSSVGECSSRQVASPMLAWHHEIWVKPEPDTEPDVYHGIVSPWPEPSANVYASVTDVYKQRCCSPGPDSMPLNGRGMMGHFPVDPSSVSPPLQLPAYVQPAALIQPTATWSVPVTPSEHPQSQSCFWSCPASPGRPQREQSDVGEQQAEMMDDDDADDPDVDVDDEKDEDYQASTVTDEDDEDERDKDRQLEEDDGVPYSHGASSKRSIAMARSRTFANRVFQPRQHTRRTATSYDAQTTHYLKSVFFNIYSKRGKLTKEQRREVQQRTGLKPRNITYWFSNHKRRFQSSLQVFKQTVRESGGRVKTYDDFLRWRRMRGLPDEVMDIEVQSNMDHQV